MSPSKSTSLHLVRYVLFSTRESTVGRCPHIAGKCGAGGGAVCGTSCHCPLPDSNSVLAGQTNQTCEIQSTAWRRNKTNYININFYPRFESAPNYTMLLIGPFSTSASLRPSAKIYPQTISIIAPRRMRHWSRFAMSVLAGRK